MTEQNATTRTAGAVAVRRHGAEATRQYERRLRELADAFELGPGVTVWATVRVEGDADPVLSVNAHAKGVRVVREVPLPAAVREGLEKAMRGAEGDVRAALKIGLARTIASSEMGFGGDQEDTA